MVKLKRVYELVPLNGRQSFYGKAKVEVYDDGSEILLSYGTKIMKKFPNGDLAIFKDFKHSNTTSSHIISYCGLNKDAFYKLPTIDDYMKELENQEEMELC